MSKKTIYETICLQGTNKLFELRNTFRIKKEKKVTYMYSRYSFLKRFRFLEKKVKIMTTNAKRISLQICSARSRLTRAVRLKKPTDPVKSNLRPCFPRASTAEIFNDLSKKIFSRF